MGSSQSSRMGGGGSGVAGAGNSLAFSTQLSKECLKQYLKKFDSDEVEVLKKVYKALSARSPGPGIDKETFLQYFPLPGLWGERLFQKFDYKGAGSVDYEEFLIGIAVCCRGTKSDRMYVLFQVFDLNSDGYIQKSELVAMLSNLPNLDKYMSIRGNKNRESEGPESSGCAGDKEATEDDTKHVQALDESGGFPASSSCRLQIQDATPNEMARESQLSFTLPEEDEDAEDDDDVPTSPPGTPLHSPVLEATLVGASDFFPSGQSRGVFPDSGHRPGIPEKDRGGDASCVVNPDQSLNSTDHVGAKPYEPQPFLSRLQQGASSSSEDDVLAPSYDDDSSGASSYSSSLSDVFGCFSPLDRPSRDTSPHRRILPGPTGAHRGTMQSPVVAGGGTYTSLGGNPGPPLTNHGNLPASADGLIRGAKNLAQSAACHTAGPAVSAEQAGCPAELSAGAYKPAKEAEVSDGPSNSALGPQTHLPAVAPLVPSPTSTQVVSISSLSPEEEAVVVPPPADRPAGAGLGSAAFPLLQPVLPLVSSADRDGESLRMSGCGAASAATGVGDTPTKSTAGASTGGGGGAEASCKSVAPPSRTPGGGQMTPVSVSLSQQAKGLSRTASRLTSALKRTFSGTRSVSPAAAAGHEQTGFAQMHAGRGKGGGASVTSTAAAALGESSGKAISVLPSRQSSEASVSQVRAVSPGSSARSRSGSMAGTAPGSAGGPVVTPTNAVEGHPSPPVVVVLASSPRAGETGLGSKDDGAASSEERDAQQQQQNQSFLHHQQHHPGTTSGRQESGETQLSSDGGGGGTQKPPTKSAMLLQAEKDKTRQEQAKKNPSPVAQSLINEEKVEESGQKDVLDVEGIVDKIIEECEFFEHGKLSFPEFKTWLERNDGILSMFTECLHEEVWGLQGNALYRSTGVQNRPSRLGAGALPGIFKDSIGSRNSGPQPSRDCGSGGGMRGSALMSSRASSLSSRGGGLARGSSPFSGGLGIGSSSSLSGDVLIRMEQFHKVKRLFTNQAHPSPRRPTAGLETGCSSCYPPPPRSSMPHRTAVSAVHSRGSTGVTAAGQQPSVTASVASDCSVAAPTSRPEPVHLQAGGGGRGGPAAHKVGMKTVAVSPPSPSSGALPAFASSGPVRGTGGSPTADALPGEAAARTMAGSSPAQSLVPMLAATASEDNAGVEMALPGATPVTALATAEATRVSAAPASEGAASSQEVRVSVSVVSVSSVRAGPEQQTQLGGPGTSAEDSSSLPERGGTASDEARPGRVAATAAEGIATVSAASNHGVGAPPGESISRSAGMSAPANVTSDIAARVTINPNSVASVALAGRGSCLPTACVTPLEPTTAADPLSAGAAAGAVTGGAVRAAAGAVAGAAAAAAAGAAAASAAKAAVEDCRAGAEGAVATRGATATAVPHARTEGAEENAKVYAEDVDQRQQAEQRDARAGGAYQRFAGYSDWKEARMSPQLAVDIVSKELVEFIRCSHQSLHAAQTASRQSQTRASPAAIGSGAPLSGGQPAASFLPGGGGGLAAGSSATASLLPSKVPPSAASSPKTEAPANATQSPRDLYSCPNCSNPLLLCPRCHSRYPQLTLYEGRVVMECVHCGEGSPPSTPSGSALLSGGSADGIGGRARGPVAAGGGQQAADDVTEGIPVGGHRRIFTHCWHCRWELSKCAELLKGSEAAIDGVLYKKGKHLHQWQARYYVLVDNMLYYYRRKGDAKPRGFMFLEGCYVELLSEQVGGRQHGFAIVHPKGETISKRLLFASSSKEQQDWVDALRMATKQQSLEQLYQVGEQLGHGKFSVVYRGVHRQTNEAFAIKVIDKGKISGHERELLRSEMAILRLLNHPNVIFMKELLDTKETLYIVMELVRGGELFDLIQQNHRLSELHVNRIISQLLSTVYYLHKCGIVHRDLKPENILLTDRTPNATIKLTDFGLSTLCAPNEVLYQPCGTLAYVAPEVLTMEGYNHQVDVWSVGVIMYLLLRGRLPFPMNKALGHPNFHQNHPVSFEGPVWREISSSAKDLIQRMLQPDPRQRVTVAEALQHIWIKNPTAVVNDGSKSIEVYINQLDDMHQAGRYVDEAAVFQAPTFTISKHPVKAVQHAAPVSPPSARATNQQALVSASPQQPQFTAGTQQHVQPHAHHVMHSLAVSSCAVPASVPPAPVGCTGGPGVLTADGGALRGAASGGDEQHASGQMSSGLSAPGPPCLGRADAGDRAAAINAGMAAAAAAVSSSPQSSRAGAAGVQQTPAQSGNSCALEVEAQHHADSLSASSPAVAEISGSGKEALRSSGSSGGQGRAQRAPGMSASVSAQSAAGTLADEKIFTATAASGGVTSASGAAFEKVTDEKRVTTEPGDVSAANENQNDQGGRSGTSSVQRAD